MEGSIRSSRGFIKGFTGSSKGSIEGSAKGSTSSTRNLRQVGPPVEHPLEYI